MAADVKRDSSVEYCAMAADVKRESSVEYCAIALTQKLYECASAANLKNVVSSPVSSEQGAFVCCET
jgi:hypothetical protein